MKKKNILVTILITVAVVVTLIAAGLAAFVIYQNTHVFVENKAYSLKATSLDLREEDISFAHYDSLHAQLPDCEILWNVPFQNGKVSSDSTRITIQNPSTQDIWLLQTYFPKLQVIDAEDCDNYTTLEQLQQALPHVAVSYLIDLGGAVALPGDTELVLQADSFDYDALREGLLFLHRMESVTLRNMNLELTDYQALVEEFPEIAFSYTVDILGQEQPHTLQELDLSAVTEENAEYTAGQLALLPELTKVELCGGDGTSTLSKQTAKTLIAAAPQAVFHYSFDFYGQTLSTDMEEVSLKNVKIGDEGEQELRLALDLLSNCRRFVLDGCGLSNEVLAQLREDYREQTKIVWRVTFGRGSTLTDAEVVRSVYDMTDSNCKNLIYCEDARYADFGHDEALWDTSFLAGMKSLEVLILSGSPVKDLSPLAQCKSLKILELSNCGYITDLSPLAECESLEMLNISFTQNITGLDALGDLNLTHFVAVGAWNKIPSDQRDAFQESHPDCMITTTGNEYGVGWRYLDSQTKMQWYLDISDAFRYPHAPNNLGWYLE